MTGALTHALADLDAVRAGRVGASDEALLDAIVLMRTLQRRVDGTLSVLLGAAEQRDAAMRLRHTPLESLLTGSGQESPCLLYTSPSPRDGLLSRMPSSA